jgi:hypothetical protein
MLQAHGQPLSRSRNEVKCFMSGRSSISSPAALVRAAPTGRGRALRARAAAAAEPRSLPVSASATKVRMATLPTCQLAVSIYPTFAYKAQDGGGAGTVKDLGGGVLGLTFDPAGKSGV